MADRLYAASDHFCAVYCLMDQRRSASTAVIEVPESSTLGTLIALQAGLRRWGGHILRARGRNQAPGENRPWKLDGHELDITVDNEEVAQMLRTGSNFIAKDCLNILEGVKWTITVDEIAAKTQTHLGPLRSS